MCVLIFRLERSNGEPGVVRVRPPATASEVLRGVFGGVGSLANLDGSYLTPYHHTDLVSHEPYIYVPPVPAPADSTARLQAEVVLLEVELLRTRLGMLFRGRSSSTVLTCSSEPPVGHADHMGSGAVVAPPTYTPFTRPPSPMDMDDIVAEQTEITQQGPVVVTDSHGVSRVICHPTPTLCRVHSVLAQ
eukprot:m51a1_g13749 hypothetical protein (189) ;mRNA; r:196839-197468